MSAHVVRHDPTGLVRLLEQTGTAEHGAARAEVFPRDDDEALVLVRCRCGRLFEAAALEAHLEDPTAPHRSTRPVALVSLR